MSLRGMGIGHLQSLGKSVRAHGFTIAALARSAARTHGDERGLSIGGWSATYDELWRAAEGVAAVLYLGPLERRIRPVVIACNGPAMAITLLAASRLGLDVSPLGAGALDDGSQLVRAVPKDALLVVDGERPDWHNGPSVSASEILEWSVTDGSGLGRTKRRSRIVLPSTTASGTVTTHVQGAMGVQGLRQLAGLLDRLDIVGTDVTLACAPLHTSTGLQIFGMALLTGANFVSAPGTSSPDRLAIIRDNFVSILQASPSQLRSLVDAVEASGEHAPRLRRILVVGEDFDAELVRRVQSLWGPIVLSAYGTVQTGTVAVATPELLAKHPGTVGTALPGCDFGIVGHRGRGDAAGALWVRGAHATVITEDRARVRGDRLTLIGSISRPDSAI